MASRRHPAKTFFLNEHHELARAEREGGGGPMKLGEIDWQQKGDKLRRDLSTARDTIVESEDPLRGHHYFLVATPAPTVPKRSSNKRKAPSGTFEEETNYAAEHSRVFRRLGMDLIGVNRDGSAVVHATPEHFDRLLTTARALVTEGMQERARWATIRGFTATTSSLRVDPGWLDQASPLDLLDVVVELQPLVSRGEAELLVKQLASDFDRRSDEMFLAAGVDFSGRRWFRGRMRASTIRRVAERFQSIQSLHPPITTPVGAVRGLGRQVPGAAARRGELVDVSRLPTVGVVDTGIPGEHAVLRPFIRGRYQHPDAPAPYLGDHASLVASRVVFGDQDMSAGLASLPAASCRVFDIMVAKTANEIDDKAVLTAIEAVVGTAPDVRVFNLSFGEVRPLASYNEVERRERLALVRDLDNLIFARDVVAVVAAGNSSPGIRPVADYPGHLDDPAWQLAAWPSGFNSLSCGAVVTAVHPDGLGSHGWPSPISRIGPGVAGAPIPEYGAGGGNVTKDWVWQVGLGVWGCSAAGDWEDRIGTSFAAPVLAREVAVALQTLQTFCEGGARPFGVTAKAFLALTASRTQLPAPVEALAARTIGRGLASAARLGAPREKSAVFLWQGVIGGASEIVRVELPIPRGWLDAALAPRLRFVCCWDPPVSDAAEAVWACRRVSVQLRPSPAARAVHGGRGAYGSRGAHRSYPIIDRTYDLSKKKLKSVASKLADTWLVELSYEQIAEYFVGMAFAPDQRVAFAAELEDSGTSQASPQPFVQAMPIAATMTRLSMPPTPVQVPVLVKTRV